MCNFRDRRHLLFSIQSDELLNPPYHCPLFGKRDNWLSNGHRVPPRSTIAISYVFLEFVTLKHSRDIDITRFLFGQTLTTYRDLGIGRVSSSWLLLLDWVIRSESGPAHKTCLHAKAQSAEIDWASPEIPNIRILLGNGAQKETYCSARTRSIPRERYRGANYTFAHAYSYSDPCAERGWSLTGIQILHKAYFQ